MTGRMCKLDSSLFVGYDANRPSNFPGKLAESDDRKIAANMRLSRCANSQCIDARDAPRAVRLCSDARSVTTWFDWKDVQEQGLEEKAAFVVQYFY